MKIMCIYLNGIVNETKKIKTCTLAANLFMFIVLSETLNFIWNRCNSDSAYLNYVEKTSSQLILRNAFRRHFLRNAWLLCRCISRPSAEKSSVMLFVSL